jgi:ATP-dependent exoDNAse (exonuclease V) beta subunit
VSIVENIIDNVVPKHSLKEESSYVLAFMDCLLEYCATNVATVHSFLRWWDDKKARLSVMTPNSVDAVNVMTIHKSKGLEFPCVILPFANWDLCRVDKLLWVDNSDILRTDFLKFSEEDASIIPPMVPISSSEVKNIAELNDVYESQAALSRIDCLNKTYVAFTRAVNELHIFSVNKMGEGDVLSERLTKALSEWDAELVKNIDADFNKQTGLTESVAVEIEKEEQQYFSGCACSVYHVGAMDQTYDPNYKEKEQHDDSEEEKKDDAEKRKIPDEIKDMPVLDWHATPIDVCVPMTFSDMQERGVKLHKLFDLLKRKKNKDRALAIGRRRGLIRDNYDEVAALLDRVLIDERTASWFDDRNKVLNERTIFYQEGDAKMNKRPDRIIRTPEGKVIVIDYKFGKNRDDDVFIAQVEGYIRMLEQSGIEVDQGYVWYPMLDVIVQVK